MFLFRKEKTLSLHQKMMTGFVLAIFSLLTMGLFLVALMVVPAWPVFAMSQVLGLFWGVFVMTLYVGVQALIHFGFPLYYANDKKCNMTGFQIFIFSALIQVVLVGLAILFTWLLS